MKPRNRIAFPNIVHTVLNNCRVLIVGGDGRALQRQRLRAAFPTTSFDWHPTRECDTRTDGIERSILSGGYDLVIVLLLARHAHTRATHQTCLIANKPLLWCRRPTATAIARAIESHHRARHSTHRN